MRRQVPSLASLSGLRIQHCCELWCRLQTCSDPKLLRLWCTATVPIQQLAWEHPYAAGVALKRWGKKRTPDVQGNKSKKRPWAGFELHTFPETVPSSDLQVRKGQRVSQKEIRGLKREQMLEGHKDSQPFQGGAN